MKNELIKLQKLMIDNLNNANDLLFKRNCKINFTNMFYYICRLIKSNRTSSKIVSLDISNSKICAATADAYVKKRKKIPAIFFEMLANDLLDFHYSINNKLLFGKYRVLSVDGTHIALSKKLANNDFKLTKNNTYVNALSSILFDSYNKTVINIELSPVNDERSMYYRQFNYLQKNDIVIHDRGYFSYSLLYKLFSINVFPIFRMKRNMNIVKKFSDDANNDKIYVINNKHTNNISVKLRLVKYKINGKLYVLGTTLLDNAITVLKNLYHDRWTIETYIRTLKCNLSFDSFHSKQLNEIQQEIHAHMCVTQITRILEELYIKHNKIVIDGTHTTNTKINLHQTINAIIKMLLFDTNKMKSIVCMLNRLFVYLVSLRPNRKFHRISIIPPSKWYLCGARCK